MTGKSLILAIGMVVLLTAAAPVTAQRAEPLPEELEGVRIEPRLGEQVPLDAAFVDDRGKRVRLSDYFGRDKPVLLNLGYYRCPMLCNLVLNGCVDALKEVDWTPGDQFEIVVVSIDPQETPTLAAKKKANYLKAYGKAATDGGWHFLTGSEEAIKSVSDAVGFYYRYVEDTNEYAHGAALFLLSPEGKLTRVLRGIQFESRTVRLSLVEASEGKQGSTVDSLLLWCFHYDATKGTYAFQAQAIMAAAAALTVLVLLAFLLPVWFRRRGRSRTAEETETPASDTK